MVHSICEEVEYAMFPSSDSVFFITYKLWICSFLRIY